MVGTCLAVVTTCDCSGVRKCVSQMIRTELSKTQRAMQLPFDLSASIGAVVAHPGEENVLESYVKRAEMLMYEEKAEKKVSRDS